MNHEIFKWAREAAGFSLAEAADTIDLKTAYGFSGAERLSQIEVGNDDTAPVPRTLLLRMAKAYRRSLLVFYLDAPPVTGDRGRDFRVAPGKQPHYSGELDALIRDVKVRQALVSSILEDEEITPAPFVGTVKIDVPVAVLVKRIIETIGFSVAEFQACNSVDDAFLYLRNRIESAGVFVVLLGNLGSHHTSISPLLFRGYAVADPIAPMIVINDQDAHSAWSFTALHELAHIWLGATGVSDLETLTDVEQYCNDVAGNILLPDHIWAEVVASVGHNVTAARISYFASRLKISHTMVTYRMYRSGMIDFQTWEAFRNLFYREWLASRQKQLKEDGKKENGPSFYVVRRHRLGSALLRVVRRSISDGQISYPKAGQILGVKPRNVDPLLFPEVPRFSLPVVTWKIPVFRLHNTVL